MSRWWPYRDYLEKYVTFIHCRSEGNEALTVCTWEQKDTCQYIIVGQPRDPKCTYPRYLGRPIPADLQIRKNQRLRWGLYTRASSSLPHIGLSAKHVHQLALLSALGRLLSAPPRRFCSRYSTSWAPFLYNVCRISTTLSPSIQRECLTIRLPFLPYTVSTTRIVLHTLNETSRSPD